MKAMAGIGILAAAAVLLGSRAGAVTVSWDDLTDAQQEAAYSSLESENESLRQQIADLQARLGGAGGSSGDAAGAGGSGDGASAGNTGDTADAGGSGETSGAGSSGDGASVGNTAGGSGDAAGAAGPAEDAAGGSSAGDAAIAADQDSFLSDLSASFASRQALAAKYTSDQIAAMSAADLWSYRFACAEAERDFYAKYSGAQFDSMNLIYLCAEYCGGLGKQYQAEETWNSSQDPEKTAQLYTAGYYNRAYALVELHDYYGLDLNGQYENLKAAVDKADAAAGEETRNAGVDSALVRQAQELLNQLGFLCGTADGIAGRQTTSCVQRFQTMYGFDPADGIIDDELIGQMKRILGQ